MDVSGKLHAPVALPPGKGPGTCSVEGWVGPRFGLDAVVKSKIPLRLDSKRVQIILK
jgi:hypothetical protein